MKHDDLVSRVEVLPRPLVNCSVPRAYDVLLDREVIAGRMHHPSHDEAVAIARTHLAAPQSPTEFDKKLGRRVRPAGRPSSAQKREREQLNDEQDY